MVHICTLFNCLLSVHAASPCTERRVEDADLEEEAVGAGLLRHSAALASNPEELQSTVHGRLLPRPPSSIAARHFALSKSRSGYWALQNRSLKPLCSLTMFAQAHMSWSRQELPGTCTSPKLDGGGKQTSCHALEETQAAINTTASSARTAHQCS